MKLTSLQKRLLSEQTPEPQLSIKPQGTSKPTAPKAPAPKAPAPKAPAPKAPAPESKPPEAQEVPPIESEEPSNGSSEPNAGQGDMEALDKCVKSINDIKEKLNKIGIILSGKFQDHSTRKKLSQITVELDPIIAMINDKMVENAASDSSKIDELLNGGI